MRNRKKATSLIRITAAQYNMCDPDIIDFGNLHLGSAARKMSDFTDVQLDSIASALVSFAQMMMLWRNTGLSKVLTQEYVEMAKKAKGNEQFFVGGEDSAEDIMDAVANMLNKGVDKNDEAYLKEVEELYGRLGEDQVISSRIPQLDAALGIGGIRRGQITTIYGPEGSGKTTTAMYFMAEQQRQGKPVFMFDSENSLSPLWMNKVGLEKKKMKKSDTSNLEDMADMLSKINSRVSNSLFVIDSVPAFLAASTLEKDSYSDHSKVAAESSVWKEILFREKPILTKNNNTLILISQERANLNRATKYDPETIIAGGKAIHYQTTTRIKCRPIKKMKAEDKISKNRMVGEMEIRFSIEKNKQFIQGIDFSVPAYNNEKIDRAVAVDDMVSSLSSDYNSIFLRKHRLDDKTGDVVGTNQLAKIVVLMDDEVLEAIRVDEPDFSPTTQVGFYYDENESGDFATWLDAHPAYMDVAEARYSQIVYWASAA